MRINALLVLAIVSAVITPQIIHAIDIKRESAAVYKKESSGDKAAVVAVKEKITVERDGILAADRRLQEAKKAGDKAQIEQVKKEVDAEIASRKAEIKRLKNELGKIEGGGVSFDINKRVDESKR